MTAATVTAVIILKLTDYLEDAGVPKADMAPWRSDSRFPQPLRQIHKMTAGYLPMPLISPILINQIKVAECP